VQLWRLAGRLKRRGLVQVSRRGGARGRKHIVSRKGTKEIGQQWRPALQRSADLDSVLKLCKICEWIDLPEAVAYAEGAAKHRRSQLRRLEGTATEKLEIDSFSFKSYKQVSNFHLLQAEEAILTAIARAQNRPVAEGNCRMISLREGWGRSATSGGSCNGLGLAKMRITSRPFANLNTSAPNPLSMRSNKTRNSLPVKHLATYSSSNPYVKPFVFNNLHQALRYPSLKPSPPTHPPNSPC
jgi:hypothetical protein